MFASNMVVKALIHFTDTIKLATCDVWNTNYCQMWACVKFNDWTYYP